MKLLISGGTGFLGASLCQWLAQRGHTLLVLTRQRLPVFPVTGVQYCSWDDPAWRQAMAEIEGVINLAGEPMAGGRWSAARKARLRASRLETTHRLVDAIAASGHKPAVLVNASAIGYYGPRGDELLSERDASGRGFLAELCQAWEAQAQQAESLGVRVVRLRIGLVLGRDGGVLAKMVPPFRAFLGGPLGSGRQWLSWIHREDVHSLIEWVLTHPTLLGAVNATAPNPATMREFCAALGRFLGRPSWLPAPAPALRLLLGEMAEMLVTGQRVVPSAARANGFSFRYPDLALALQACVA